MNKAVEISCGYYINSIINLVICLGPIIAFKNFWVKINVKKTVESCSIAIDRKGS